MNTPGVRHGLVVKFAGFPSMNLKSIDGYQVIAVAKNQDTNRNLLTIIPLLRIPSVAGTGFLIRICSFRLAAGSEIREVRRSAGAISIHSTI